MPPHCSKPVTLTIHSSALHRPCGRPRHAARGQGVCRDGRCQRDRAGDGRDFVRRGATVCIADVDADALRAAEARFAALEGRFTATRIDVTRRREVDAWIEGIAGRFGRLDGAANVAGIIGKAHGVNPVVEMDDDEWHRIMAVNLTGMMYCLRAELRAGRRWRLHRQRSSSVHGLKGELCNSLFPFLRRQS